MGEFCLLGIVEFARMLQRISNSFVVFQCSSGKSFGLQARISQRYWFSSKGSNGDNDDHSQNDNDSKDSLIPLESNESNSSKIDKLSEVDGKNEKDSKDSYLSKPSIPENVTEILGIPIPRRPLFPGFYKTISIKNPKISNLLTSMLRRGNPWIGVFLERPEFSLSQQDDNNGDSDKTADDKTKKSNSSQQDIIRNIHQIYPVGVFAQLINVFPGPPTEVVLPLGKESKQSTNFTAIVYPHRRIRALELLAPSASSQIRRLRIENVVQEQYDSRSRIVRAISQEIFAVLSDIAKLNSFFREHIMHHNVPTAVFEDPAKLADFVTVLSSGEPEELQQVLECVDIEERLRKALELLKKELVTAQLQYSISKDVENKLTQKQREYFLNEQLKVIKRELGLEADTKDKLIETFKQRIEKLTLPAVVEKVYQEEISKLQVLEPNGSEFNVTRNYLDWISQLPWGITSDENLDHEHASKVLNEDHYGLEDIKNRILEFIAVGKLRGNVQGKILCFVGPPGVGKTSIGKSIARALNRKYFRFSVGGLSDVAEIKGHRRTYVGAMPGKVIQALKSVQTENPLILIDEIDKISHMSHQGDPSSALLELLDPEQNKSFLDHYLDVPVDLGKVLFVCTANVLDTIPGPLLDRMEIINLSGYIAEEKKQIARQYLIPAALTDSGLAPPDAYVISDNALDRLIRYYCRENGVRNLKKHIEKIFRKVAFQLVSQRIDSAKRPFIVDQNNLAEFVGQPPFSSDKIYPDSPPVGVVMGLAWTPMGGSVLYIETVGEKNATPIMTKTGQLGKVMDESSVISYTFAKDFVSKRFPTSTFLSSHSVHLHVPEGAIHKDGPSAGVTMATALISLASGQPIKAGIAMTGELTLTGKILKIGGLKEKTIAAKNAGVKKIIFPQANLSDWHEIPDFVREGLEFFPVQEYQQVYDICFPSQ